MKPHTIIFIGPQGSGKGTQVQHLIKYLEAQDPAYPVMDIETGRIFRTLAETGNATALRIKELIEEGKPVPDAVTNSFVMADFRDRFTAESHIVLDGYPRNVAQASFLDTVLSFYERTAVSVIYLETAEEVVRERMRERGRQDDTEEKITERLRWSMEMMENLLAYYHARPDTDFVTVDGASTIEAVQASIRTGLKLT